MMRSAISTASRALLTTALAASAATAVITAAPSEAAAQVSIVRINGIATPVYFNDGDTFRPLGGPFRFRPARLAGTIPRGDGSPTGLSRRAGAAPVSHRAWT